MSRTVKLLGGWDADVGIVGKCVVISIFFDAQVSDQNIDYILRDIGEKEEEK